MRFPASAGTPNKVLDGYYFLRKSVLTEEQIAAHIEALEVQSTTMHYITGNPAVVFSAYKDSPDWLGVPPIYGLEEFGQPDNTFSREGLPISVEVGGLFRGYRTDYDQKGVVEHMLDVLRGPRGAAQLCLDTGLGKTICALLIIAAIGRKTLVVVHKRDSITQWTKKINQFLPGAKVGEMRANVLRVDDCDIVLTTVQSLSMKKYPREVLDQFGFVIADEVHLMAAETFHLAFTRTCFRYRLGMSATPIRRDGLSCVIRWFFGDIECQIDQPRTDISVEVVHYKAGEQIPRWIGIGFRKKPNKTAMVTDLVKDAYRNSILVDRVMTLCSNESQTLLLSERVKHVDEMAALIRAALARRAPEDSKLMTVAALSGKCKEPEREAAKLADVICATVKMAKDSLDLENLTSMVIATPVSAADIQQIRGRLLRKPLEDTEEAGDIDRCGLQLVHMFDDWKGDSMFTGLFWRVHKFYKERGYTIRHTTIEAADV